MRRVRAAACAMAGTLAKVWCRPDGTHPIVGNETAIVGNADHHGLDAHRLGRLRGGMR
jgi:hypothetical protein